MAKHQGIVKGTRAETPFELPPTPQEEQGLACLLRPLNGIEEEACLAAARLRATSVGGIEDPRPGEPIYDFALMVETVAVACMDPDSPRDARETTFADADAVREAYGREAITYIYEVQQHWQDACSPRISKLSAKQYIDAVAKLGGPEEEARRFFFQCAPGLLWSLLRTMAVQLWNSLTDKSTSSESSESSSTSSKNDSKT